MESIVHGVAKSWTQLSDFSLSLSCFLLKLTTLESFTSLGPYTLLITKSQEYCLLRIVRLLLSTPTHTSLVKLTAYFFIVKSMYQKKTLMLGRTEDKRRSGQQRMRQLDSITDSMDKNLSTLQEMVKDRGAWHTAAHGAAESDTAQ